MCLSISDVGTSVGKRNMYECIFMYSYDSRPDAECHRFQSIPLVVSQFHDCD